MLAIARHAAKAAVCATLLFSASSVLAQVSLTTVGVPVTQNFDSLLNTGTTNVWTDNSTIVGWYSTRTVYRAGTGSDNAGALYSLGSSASTERALGSLGSGTTGTIFNAVRLVNNTGGALTGFTVSYVGEQWRNAAAATHQLTFEYQIANAGVITGSNVPSTGWTAVTALDFISPITTGGGASLDGNLPANRVALSQLISAAVVAGQEVWLRWVDPDDGGADHALAIDDFSVTAQGGPPLPTLSINDVAMAEGTGGTSQFTFSAQLSAPAGAGGVSFTAQTADGSATLADMDYVQLNPTVFMIAAGLSNVDVAVTVNGDADNEPNENFLVNLSGLSGAQAGDLSGQGTIQNDDGVTPISVSLNDPSRTEGDSGTSPLTFTVSLDSAAGPGGVSFDIATNPGTAQESLDFLPRTLSNQNIAEGQSSFNFVVQVVGDIVPETPTAESFTVTLSNVSGHGGGSVDNSATGTINDNDPIPRTIAELQGTGVASPFAATVQTTLGNIVTAVGSDLFAMQMPSPGDGNAFTSDGILVFTGGAPTVVVGDVVDVKGNLVEFFEQTEFTVTGGGLTVNIVGSAPLPTPTSFDQIIPSPAPGALACQGGGSTIPTGAAVEVQNFECFEAMRVSTSTGIINSPHQAFGADPIAEPFFATSGARVKREAGVDPAVANEPGLPVGVALWDGNPELFEIDPDKLGLPNDILIPGSRISATGVIGYDFGDYELWPTAMTVDSAAQIPVPAPIAGYNQISIASFNVENLFDTVDDPLTEDTILTPAELAHKLGKLSAYIRTVLNSPHVVGLIEVENQTAVNALIAQIQADDPTVQYSGMIFVGNDPRGINNAFIYRNVSVDSVVQLRANQMTNECSSTPPCTLHDRPTLLLQGRFSKVNGQMQNFAVMVSHLRSLSGIDNQTALSNALRVRRKRLEQAVAVAEESQAFQVANPSVPLVSLGDFNAFEFTDGYTDVMGIVRGDANVDGDALPRDTMFEIQDIYPAISGNIVSPPMLEAMYTLPADDQYSFFFGCGVNFTSVGCFAQVLDHTLLSASAQPFFADFGFGRGNAEGRIADEAVALSPLRSSDHDGSVLILNLGDELLGDGFE